MAPQNRLRPGTYSTPLSRRFALIGGQKIVKKSIFFQILSKSREFRDFARIFTELHVGMAQAGNLNFYSGRSGFGGAPRRKIP
jgi:hypothetical protein